MDKPWILGKAMQACGAVFAPNSDNEYSRQFIDTTIRLVKAEVNLQVIYVYTFITTSFWRRSCQMNSNNEVDMDYMIMAMGLLLNLCDRHIDHKEHGKNLCQILVTVSGFVSI